MPEQYWSATDRRLRIDRVPPGARADAQPEADVVLLLAVINQPLGGRMLLCQPGLDHRIVFIVPESVDLSVGAVEFSGARFEISQTLLQAGQVVAMGPPAVCAAIA